MKLRFEKFSNKFKDWWGLHSKIENEYFDAWFYFANQQPNNLKELLNAKIDTGNTDNK